MHVKVRHLACAAALAVPVALPASASAATNPYTAEGVCGPGYQRIGGMPITDGDRLLANVVLTYNASTGKNCAVTLKRYRVGETGRGDRLWASIDAGSGRPDVELVSDYDTGNFKYFAGPTYVYGRSRCVNYHGVAELGAFSARRDSGFVHCR